MDGTPFCLEYVGKRGGEQSLHVSTLSIFEPLHTDTLSLCHFPAMLKSLIVTEISESWEREVIRSSKLSIDFYFFFHLFFFGILILSPP